MPASAGVVLDEVAIQRALMRIAREIVERNDDPGRLYLVATPNGGPPLARQIARNLREIVGVAVERSPATGAPEESLPSRGKGSMIAGEQEW